MRRILLALCGTMVLVLLGLSPGYAQPFYQSDLFCFPTFEASHGITVIKASSGDLYARLTTDPRVPNTPFSCSIQCLVGPGFAFAADCGTSSAAGILTFIVPRLGNRDSLGLVGTGVDECRSPSVQVFTQVPPFIFCQSGYRAP